MNSSSPIFAMFPSQPLFSNTVTAPSSVPLSDFAMRRSNLARSTTSDTLTQMGNDKRFPISSVLVTDTTGCGLSQKVKCEEYSSYVPSSLAFHSPFALFVLTPHRTVEPMSGFRLPFASPTIHLTAFESPCTGIVVLIVCGCTAPALFFWYWM